MTRREKERKTVATIETILKGHVEGIYDDGAGRLKMYPFDIALLVEMELREKGFKIELPKA